MNFEIVCAKVVGKPDSAGWCQAYDFKPEEEDKFKIRGRLYAVVATSTHAQGLDAVTAGREVLGRLHEEYFGRNQGSAYEALRQAVKKVIAEFTLWEGVEIGAVSLVGDIAYCVAGGGAGISIFRDGVFAPIVKSSRGKVLSASGYQKDGDLLLIGTNSFFETQSSGVLRGIISGKDPASAVEALAPIIHSQDESGNIGAIFLKTKKPQVYSSRALVGDVVEKSPSQNLGDFFKKHTLALMDRIKPRVYIRENERGEVGQKKGVSASVGGILLLLLILSIFFGIRQRRLSLIKESYQERLISASHQLEEAEVLYPLNPQRARELFSEARGKVLGLTDERIKDPELEKLRERIKDSEGKILGEYRTDPELFLDLSLLSNPFEADSAVASGDRVFIFDKKNKKLVAVSISSKRSEILAGPAQLGEAESVAAYSDRIFVVTQEGVVEVGGDKVIEADWMGEVLPYAYGGNFYILDKGANKIYRYAGFEGGFSVKREWFTEGVDVDLSKALTWVIDGAIWVLAQNGKILKFALGNPQPLSLSGIIPDIINSSAIFTSDETEYFYILEKDTGRVVVVTKEGEYKAQYLSDKIKEVKGLVVSEKERKIILLTGDKLYSIEIKHL